MKLVKMNQKLHNQDSPLLIGDFNDDIVKEVRNPAILTCSLSCYKYYLLLLI